MGLLGLARKMPNSSPACLPPSPSPRFISSGICVPARLFKDKEWKTDAVQHCQSRRLSITMKAVENQGTVAKEDMSDNKILPYCSIDKKTDKKSLGELELEFLEALQSFYYDKKPIMSNEEFDLLKEELTWQGSSVVILSSDEQRFMETCLAYAAGKPNITDAEFDALKLKLKKQGSKVAIEGPRCSLRSKKLPEPYSFVFTWFVVLPITFFIAQSLTNAILKDFLILKGPCPNCGAENNSFFGTILTIPSGGDSNIVKCEKCSSMLKFDVNTRLITLENTFSNKAKGPPKAPKKEVASGASTN